MTRLLPTAKMTVRQNRTSTTKILRVALGLLLCFHFLKKVFNVFCLNDLSLLRKFAQEVVQRSTHFRIPCKQFASLKSVKYEHELRTRFFTFTWYQKCLPSTNQPVHSTKKTAESRFLLLLIFSSRPSFLVCADRVLELRQERNFPLFIDSLAVDASAKGGSPVLVEKQRRRKRRRVTRLVLIGLLRPFQSTPSLVSTPFPLSRSFPIDDKAGLGSIGGVIGRGSSDAVEGGGG